MDDGKESELERMFSYPDKSPPRESLPPEEPALEEYSVWTDRIWREYHQKHYASKHTPRDTSGSKNDYDFVFDVTELQHRAQSETKKSIAKLRAKYQKRWDKLLAKLSLKRCKLLRISDIPIPSVRTPETLDSVEEFLFADVTECKRRKEISQLLIWHPDKWPRERLERFAAEDREKVAQKLQDMCGILNMLKE